ncbi:hypothetical protein TIFTF001_031361 [Ficus carica]|uniref:Uncharacterized protein n=1 Tax=Ficus carica TaxID=3494 RepID=A0AA88DUU6_FICCA|nr:hypothetical protein TIFTF001_031361 [Ficus carica]
MAARHDAYTYVMLIVVLAERKLITYVYAVEAHLQVPLASRCLAVDARLWWMSLGEPAIPRGSWADFRALIIARYGPLPDEEANMPYRDPDIYNDMNMRRYLNYLVDWRAYLNESMGHYCRRLQNAMLPYIPRDLGNPELQALHLLREGLPPEVKQFNPAMMTGVTLESLIDVVMEAEIVAHLLQGVGPKDDYLYGPVDNAGIREPPFQGGSIPPEDPVPAVSLQEIPPQEAEAGANGDDMDPADFPVDLEEYPEDPPVIIIASDDEGEEWEEQEGDIEEELVNLEEQEEDPEEILFDDGDWDVDSNASSVVTTE